MRYQSHLKFKTELMIFQNMALTGRLLLYFLCSYTVLAEKANYNNHQVWKVVPSNDEAKVSFKQLVHKLEDQLDVDLWGLKDVEADIMVHQDQIKDVQLALDKMGLDYKVKVESLGKLIQMEEEEIAMADRSMRLDVGQYHNLDEIYAHLHDLADKHEHISVVSIGKSFEGREMLVARICVGGCDNKKVMWIDSGIHSREWIAPAANVYMLNKLADKLSKGEDEDLFQVDWYIMPVLNPDGYVYTWTTERMWRKTRHVIKANGDCVGVDPNRNFDASWGTEGASDNPCEATYRGPHAFSEVELVNLKNYLTKTLRGNVIYYMNIHSYSQLIMYPFGATNATARDALDIDNVAKKAYNALKSVRGSKFAIGPIYSTIYPASGNSVDWAYSKAGIKYSFTIELSPEHDGLTGHGFVLPAKNIMPVGEELLAFHESVARDMITEFIAA